MSPYPKAHKLPIETEAKYVTTLALLSSTCNKNVSQKYIEILLCVILNPKNLHDVCFFISLQSSPGYESEKIL